MIGFQCLPAELVVKIYDNINDIESRKAFRFCSHWMRNSVAHRVTHVELQLSNLKISPFWVHQLDETAVEYAMRHDYPIRSLSVTVDCPSSWVGRMTQLMLQLKHAGFNMRFFEIKVQSCQNTFAWMRSAEHMFWNMGVLLRRAAPNLEELHIDQRLHLSSDFFEGLFQSPMKSICTFGAPITSDKFPRCFENMLYHCPNLVNLGFTHGVGQTLSHVTGISRALSTSYCLRSVYLSNPVAGLDWGACPTITCICLQIIYEPCAGALHDLLKCGPALKEINIGTLYINHQPTLEALTNTREHLKHVEWKLFIAACDGEYLEDQFDDPLVPESAMSVISERMALTMMVIDQDVFRVKEVQLECMHLHRTGMFKLSAALPRLEQLHLYRCTMVDRAGKETSEAYPVLTTAVKAFLCMRTLTWGGGLASSFPLHDEDEEGKKEVAMYANVGCQVCSLADKLVNEKRRSHPLHFCMYGDDRLQISRDDVCRAVDAWLNDLSFVSREERGGSVFTFNENGIPEAPLPWNDCEVLSSI